MKIFLVISSLFVISFFFITKDKGEELKTVDVKLEKIVIVEKLKNLYSIVKSRPSFKKILADRIIGVNPHSDYLKLDY